MHHLTNKLWEILIHATCMHRECINCNFASDNHTNLEPKRKHTPRPRFLDEEDIVIHIRRCVVLCMHARLFRSSGRPVTHVHGTLAHARACPFSPSLVVCWAQSNWRSCLDSRFQCTRSPPSTAMYTGVSFSRSRSRSSLEKMR